MPTRTRRESVAILNPEESPREKIDHRCEHPEQQGPTDQGGGPDCLGEVVHRHAVKHGEWRTEDAEVLEEGTLGVLVQELALL